jgi:cell division septation protein DedD
MREALQRNRLESSRMVRQFWIVVIAAVIPAMVNAQETAVVNPVYKRAQTLVNDGNATAGRALVDSMINAAAPGSNDYAEAVFWRAVLAGTAADAEMDYRRIVVDYPRSPRVEDALIRLSQLEIARANYDGAIRHLNTLMSDYPQSPSRARAGYWIARALFDKNDTRGGCVATADALGRTSEDDVELRNQITYLNQRCAGVDLTPAAPAAAVLPSSPPVTPAPRDTATRIVTPPALPEKAAVDSAKIQRASTPTPITKPVPVEPSRIEEPLTVKAPAGKPKSSTGTVYSVQIAAYNVKSQATAMVAKLKKRGYEARVDGAVAPFRVRIGKYATQAQASAVQRSLKAKQITGFVVQAETQ